MRLIYGYFFEFFLLIFSIAPVSSITSIALSGKNLSLIYLDDKSIEDLIAHRLINEKLITKINLK